MNGHIPSRRQARIALLAYLLLIPSTTKATFDLTGDWLVKTPFFDSEEVISITQEGTTLQYGFFLSGTIDPEVGTFTVVIRQEEGCYPIAIRAQLTDVNHFEGNIVGQVLIFLPPCRFVDWGFVEGDRVVPIPTLTPMATATTTPTVTPTARPCIGDCDGNGIATVDDIIALVRCALDFRLDVFNPCVDCADANGSGRIEVSELVTAVNNALRGCGH